ncbi:hypothetical protein LSTR_LSTR011558 [Laodelphax striatellus]|uniref:MADF domain-containing protein n=1 Tax=Laodelphax striatellus TaxID=195883 RepID=A0A482XA94_LAOST|nr:hypothetical protein LSTR_LSTR011558 [Laodelphax striatellus]
MKWSVEETIKLVQLYGEFECLWNITCVDYKNKTKRASAYEAIVTEFNKQDFGVAELKQKIKNLRCTYNQERLKVEKSNKSGAGIKDVYIPALKWFHIMETFMTSIKGTSETEDNLNKTNSEQNDEIDFMNDDEDTPSLSHPHQSQSTAQASTSKETETHQLPKQPFKKAKYSKKRNSEQLRESVAELCNIHGSLTANASQLEDNDNTAFGAYVGVTLNKLPLEESIVAQHEIQSILTKYRLQSCSQAAPFPHLSDSLPSGPPSTTSNLWLNHSIPIQREDRSISPQSLIYSSDTQDISEEEIETSTTIE